MPSCAPEPIRTVTGTIKWGRTPVGSVRLELWQRYDGGVITTTTSAADGRYTLQVPSGTSTDAFLVIPPQTLYRLTNLPLVVIAYQDPAVPCGTRVVDMPLYRTTTVAITGTTSCGTVSAPPCDARLPMTVTWSAVPTASYYCIEVLSNDTGQFLLTGPVCDGSSSYMYSGPATTYTVTGLRPGRYQFIVLAVLAGDGTHPAPFDGIMIADGDIYFLVN